MKRSEILERARQCVCEDRDKQYGSPEDSFGKIAELWSAYRGELFLKRDVAMMMALVKIARIYAGESADSYVDLAGYAACGGELATEGKNEKQETEGKNEKPAAKEIYKVPNMHGKRILENGKRHAPREKFYFNNGAVWVGVDNATGDLWVEDFETEEGCVAWLRGEKEAEEETE